MDGIMEEIYKCLFMNSAPLTREWILISSPFPLMLIIFGYLYFVLYAGPRYMQNQLPYKLKTFIMLYNLIQILANIWMVKEHLSFGWFSKYGITCSSFPYSTPDSLNAIKIFHCVWWLFLLKIFDLVETCVFVLRKKQNQVSKLHVYHHVSNIFFGWIYLKYILEERMTFISLINCAVHVIMYTYYFISAKSKYRQIISPVKPFITRIQMMQFIVMIIFVLQVWDPNCHVQFEYVTLLAFIFITNLLIFFYLFYDFYKKSYTNVSKKD
ncbi:very long chain fatty acid elongase AAEL008004-like isoform X2 [Anoplolepis gracilipes]|uniref:very long chain fatty acid elongase AAEL008004-like isoform X2 n=1 Tax=Anoplolepis gracilipes TaxID=354296 RepID=UPI003B9E0EE2